jgi:enoyl-CoA hydratase/carnithine racemase
MSEPLLYDVADRIATITFNRPERMNTITRRMLEQFSELLLRADRDPEVRAIIITGNGKAWCAGLDLAAAQAGDAFENDGKPTLPPGEFDLREAPPIVLNKIDTPTIAALNGGAAGYGMDLALGCDLRIASNKAKLSAAYTARNLVPESGGTWLLPRIIGWSQAADLLFTARTLTADEALDMGLVSEVVEPDALGDAARVLAGRIAANGPLAVRAAKRMMRHAMSEDFEDHVQRQYLALLPLFATKDFREGIAAYMEKREAEFTGQ